MLGANEVGRWGEGGSRNSLVLGVDLERNCKVGGDSRNLSYLFHADYVLPPIRKN